jgi:hypothetical protein
MQNSDANVRARGTGTRMELASCQVHGLTGSAEPSNGRGVVVSTGAQGDLSEVYIANNRGMGVQSNGTTAQHIAGRFMNSGTDGDYVGLLVGGVNLATVKA